MLDRWNNLLKGHPGVANWLLVLINVSVFRGMLANGVVYDDGKQVLENPYVLNAHLWRRIFTGSVWSFQGPAVQTNFYRPLHIFSHWLVWRVAGANPAAFHLYQLIFYALTALLVFRLGRELGANHLVSFAGALLWVLHPLHVEPVCWIAGVPDVGCALFCMLAFLFFLRAERAPARRWAWQVLAAVAFFLALLFKESAISFPVLLGVYWIVLGKQESWWQRGVRWLPYGLVTGVYLELRLIILGHISNVQHSWRVPPRIAEAAIGLLGQHTKLFFWPTRLSDFRSFDLVPSLLSPWPWVTLLAAGLALTLRRRDPLLRFLVLWWVVMLLPCLDARQLSVLLLAERFSYLPSVGLCLAVTYIALSILPAGIPHRRLGWALVPALGLALVLFAFEDRAAIPRWRDNDTLWNYSYLVSPQSAMVHSHRALDLQYRDGDLVGATREYETALQLNRTSFVYLPSLTHECLVGLGQVANLRGHTEEAIAYFQKAIDVTPNFSSAYDSLGAVYFPRGDYARAAEYFERAVACNPMDLTARFFLGTCWLKLAKPAQAAEQFRAARTADPDYLQAYEAEARALEAAGDRGGAARVRAALANR